MTDERLGARVLATVKALPKGSGIIFRHYSLSPQERRELFDAVRKAAKARRHCLLLAGDARLARAWRADGWHGRGNGRGNGSKNGGGLHSAPIHSIRERVAAERSGAAMIFVSPVFATRSHTGGRALGFSRFGAIVSGTRLPVIALGGMTEKRARSLAAFRIQGWAAIDALAR